MKIYLPNDADGNVIPSNVKVMYKKNGTQVHVDDLVHGIVSKSWSVYSGYEVLSPSSLYLTKPDTPEQLIEDIKRAQDACNRKGNHVAACTYSGNSTCSGCDFGCDFFVGTDTCISKMLGDIVTRVHRLCGDAE